MRWHFTITSDMKDLGLSGNDLLVYAVIAGYSANRQGCYYGSLAYLCEVTGIARRTAIDVLKRLTDRGLLHKEEHIENNVRRCIYEVRGGGAENAPEVQNLHGGGANSAPNNKYNNKYLSPRILKDTAPQGGASQKDVLEMFAALGCEDSVLRDWVAARKGAKVTPSVLQGMQREAAKAGITLAEAVRICAENSWRGFRADYLHKGGAPAPGKQRSVMDGMKKVAANLWGTDPFGNPLTPEEIARRKAL